MNKFLNILRNKEGKYSLRRITALLFALAILTSWIAEQFFGIPTPEFMFRLMAELVKFLFSDIN